MTIGGAAILATVGGSVVLAKTSDGFRKFAENNIPGSSFLFNLLLGPSLPQLPKFEPPSKYSIFKISKTTHLKSYYLYYYITDHCKIAL